MPRHPLTSALVASAIALVAACSGPPAASQPTSGMVDASASWQLASGTVDGAPLGLAPNAPVTLTVGGTEVSGRSACNWYTGRIVVDAGVLRIDQTSSTEMACEEPAMATEAEYLAALARVRRATRDGDRLTLLGPGVELSFDELAPPPVAEIVGTDWILESLLEGDVASSVGGDRMTLRLDADGTFKGGTGCRTFSGRWIIEDGGIRPTDLAMDQTDCAPPLVEQDQHVVTVLEGFRASVDGQTLTLTGGGGDGLMYRAGS